MTSQEPPEEQAAPVSQVVEGKEADANDQPTVSSTQSTSDAELDETKEGQEPKATTSPPTTTGDTKEPEWAHGFQLFTILVAVTFVCFLMLLDGTIVVAAVPRITDDFNSLNDIGWYGAAYQLGRCVKP